MSRKPKIKKQLTVEQVATRRTVFSFAVLFVMAGLAYGGWQMLRHEERNSGVQKTLRAGLEVNEKIFSGLYDTAHLAKEYPVSVAEKARVNGKVGLINDADTSGWQLKVARGAGDTLYLTMADIKALPKTEIVFDFKCVEGWSQVTHWGGVRFSDFAKKYGLTEQVAKRYTGLITPDKMYYVGLDMPSMLHPQTLLCYEVNGAELPLDQGYPLRLIIPVKYGIKHLKRIGTVYFSNDKPKDYWAERGYDYFAGL